MSLRESVHIRREVNVQIYGYGKDGKVAVRPGLQLCYDLAAIENCWSRMDIVARAYDR